MKLDLETIIESYDAKAQLEQASTIPASWYTDERLFDLERRTVFSRTWQFAARSDQLQVAGDYVTTEIAGEPIATVLSSDNDVRRSFNGFRHHAAAAVG